MRSGNVLGLSEAMVSCVGVGEHVMAPDTRPASLRCCWCRVDRSLDALVVNDEQRGLPWLSRRNDDLNGGLRETKRRCRGWYGWRRTGTACARATDRMRLGQQDDWIGRTRYVADAVCWRTAQAPHQVATLRLVDTPDEQALLEQPALRAADRARHDLLQRLARNNRVHRGRNGTPTHSS